MPQDHELKPSLLRIASEAGVSKATVSRVLSGSSVHIAPETRQRVQRIADGLGYSPNRAAQALVTGHAQAVALWTVNLSSPFSAQVIHHLNREIMRHEYDLMIAADQREINVALNISRLMSWPIDGILALDLPRAEIPELEKSLLGGKPFVSMGGYVSERTDYVHVDFAEQVKEAIRHLHLVGCERIAYLVPDWFDWFRHSKDARLTGYDAVMGEMGRPPEYIAVPDVGIVGTGGCRESVDLPLSEYIERRGCPDGLFCFNDDMAIGAYRTLRDLGGRIPEDVALVGCDGIRDTLYMDPRITTIVQPLEHMCMIAWTFLERRIRNKTIPLQGITVQPKLEIKGSSQR